MDNKLNWTEQIGNIGEKVKKSSSVLKRLAGNKWDSTMEVLNNTYCTYRIKDAKGLRKVGAAFAECKSKVNAQTTFAAMCVPIQEGSD